MFSFIINNYTLLLFIMALSIGLVISLGTTLLLCGLIFIFFRRRMQLIDNKINQALNGMQEISYLLNRKEERNEESSSPLFEHDTKLVKVSDNETIVETSDEESTTSEEEDSDHESNTEEENEEDLDKEKGENILVERCEITELDSSGNEIEEPEETDYKKLNVSKLRLIVEEKKLHEDPKKLKKSELITLLQN